MSVSIPTGWLKRLLIPLELGAILILLASPANAAEPMALGIATQPSAALLQIAVERGLLEAEGVDATVTRYPSGKRALLDGLFAGKAQVISAADAPIVANAFKRDDFAVIGTIFFADNVNSIIARRDAGITEPGDLNGKRLATQRASAVHYFLHLFLLKHQISHEGLDKQFMQAVASLSSGRPRSASGTTPSSLRSRASIHSTSFSSSPETISRPIRRP
jgi:ABC-type nitrate/sulfonate/bicarbonate transport system substrate-binding protein